jgi:hypothetical protein
MTTATWYLVRYMPDLQRREPRNVGVVLRTGDGLWLSKFIGEKDDGNIDGRHLRRYDISSEVYKTWVRYFRRKAADDSWPDVQRMQSARIRNYFTEQGGQYLGRISSSQSLLDDLYSRLVEEETLPALPSSVKPLSPTDYLVSRVDEVLARAGVQPQRDVEVEARYGDKTDTVPFRYSYKNGQVHLMDLVTTRKNAQEAAKDSRELRARVQGVRDAGNIKSFVAFYDRDFIPHDELEHILRPIEGLSLTVDINQKTDATQSIRQIMTHQQ